MFVRSAATAIALMTLGIAAHAGPKSSPELNQAAADCFGKTGAGWAKVIESCTKLIKANIAPGTKAGAYFNRGSAQLRLQFGGNALADFNEAIKLRPNFERALEARAGVYVGQGKFDLAIADLNKAISLDPKSSVAYNNRGLAHLGKKDVPKAIADLTKAIELDPKDPTSYATRATAYATSGEDTKALADLDRAIAMDPKQVVALFNRGTIKVKQGDKSAAKADFDAVLKLVPDHEHAKQALAGLSASGN
jgi:tetratricopeptide (TPR) repeat protein